MSMSANLNKFSFTNPGVREPPRQRASTISHTPCRPRSAIKRASPAHVSGAPLMIHTAHKGNLHYKSQSAPCLPKHKTTNRTFVAPQQQRPKKRSNSPSPRTRHHSAGGGAAPTLKISDVTGDMKRAHKRSGSNCSTKASGTEKLAKALAAAGSAAVAGNASRSRSPSATRQRAAGGGKGAAPGHASINTTEHVYSPKEPEKKPELQNHIGGTALTSSTPTALSSHMDPRMLQAVSGIAGAGFVASQMPNHEEGEDSEKLLDASLVAQHPEQLGPGGDPTTDEQDSLEVDGEERIPSDLMKAKLIVEGSAEAELESPSITVTREEMDPLLSLPEVRQPDPPPQASTPQASTPQTIPLLPPPHGLPTQASAPAYHETEGYGENLYTKTQGYDPSNEQFHLSSPLLDNPQDQYQPDYGQEQVPQYQPHHVGYHYNPDPSKYNYVSALQNYSNTHSDGMYCYSCIMFLGVVMIGLGIILIIVKLFRLFGNNFPLAIVGAGLLILGICTLALSMLAWRRRRSALKKKHAHV